MSKTKEVLAANLNGMAIDRICEATSKVFTIDFQMGGYLSVTVKDGKLVYSLFDVDGDIVSLK